jgi:hypothetical protein
VDESITNFQTIIERIFAQVTPHVLVANMSPITPGERGALPVGLQDGLFTRIRKHNVALADLAARMGFGVVDVDRVVAERGARDIKLDVSHLNEEGNRLVAEEVVRVMDEMGVFDE